MAESRPTLGGILFIDKPDGISSHGVVARVRKALGTRKVGHAGTLDPMATGLLVIGVDGSTRLLTYLVGLDKTYLGTIRLGAVTTTDDAEGDIVEQAQPAAVAAINDIDIDEGIAKLTGEIEQVPSAVSAIKVDGKRAYDRVRAGEDVKLKARAVTVSKFEVRHVRRVEGWIDIEVEVDCSSGTYIRALARDLGADLEVGGHLTSLRRTRVGSFEVADAAPIHDIEREHLVDPTHVMAAVMPVWHVSDQAARDLRHGKKLAGAAADMPAQIVAAIDQQGALIGVIEARGAAAASVMNMPEQPEAGA